MLSFCNPFLLIFRLGPGKLSAGFNCLQICVWNPLLPRISALGSKYLLTDYEVPCSRAITCLLFLPSFFLSQVGTGLSSLDRHFSDVSTLCCHLVRRGMVCQKRFRVSPVVSAKTHFEEFQDSNEKMLGHRFRQSAAFHFLPVPFPLMN